MDSQDCKPTNFWLEIYLCYWAGLMPEETFCEYIKRYHLEYVKLGSISIYTKRLKINGTKSIWMNWSENKLVYSISHCNHKPWASQHSHVI